MLEDALGVAMPNRSQLYSVSMEGTNGLDQESVLDYAQRLSVRHSVRVRDLFARVILPETGIKSAFYVPGHFSCHSIRGCNGWSSYGRAFLGALQRLTGRADLERGTLAAWAPVLHGGNYAARNRRWCPLCLADLHDGCAVYRLAWSFRPVEVCALHEVRLSGLCGRCRRPQPLIGDSLALGLCEFCRAPLAQAALEPVLPKKEPALYFKALALAEMIDATSAGREHLQAATYTSRLISASAVLANGSMTHLEEVLNFTPRSLTAGKPPMLSRFLEVLYRLNTKPLAFLRGVDSFQIKGARLLTPYRTVRYTPPSEVADAAKRVEARLVVAFATVDRLTTRVEFCHDVGISSGTFQRRFPRCVAALRAHNDLIRPALRRTRWERTQKSVLAAMRDLVSQRGPFTSKEIERSLNQMGLSIRNSDVRNFVKATIKDLLSI